MLATELNVCPPTRTKNLGSSVDARSLRKWLGGAKTLKVSYFCISSVLNAASVDTFIQFPALNVSGCHFYLRLCPQDTKHPKTPDAAQKFRLQIGGIIMENAPSCRESTAGMTAWVCRLSVC